MTVMLDITADDVAHSWWIPKLGGKMDASPATPTRPGSRSRRRDRPASMVYNGQCAELCGRNHAEHVRAA